jgi:hypothetical protein
MQQIMEKSTESREGIRKMGAKDSSRSQEAMERSAEYTGP